MAIDDELTVLVRQHGDQLVRMAYQLTHERAAAEDLVQDALYQVYRGWRNRPGSPDMLEAYLRRTILNVFLKKAQRRASSELVQSEPAERQATGSFEQGVADQDALWRALATLSPRQRAVLVLRFYEELPDQQIASILRCRRATVRSLAARGLAALHQPLTDEHATAPPDPHSQPATGDLPVAKGTP